MQKHMYPVAAAITVAVIFGFSFIFTKGALFYLNPFQLLGLRFALAALFLTLLAAGRLVKLNIRLSHLPDLLKIAIWQPVLYFTCETYGVKYTSASESGVIIALIPVVVAFLSLLILREKISLPQGICINIAVVGVVLMTLGGTTTGNNEPSSHLLGYFLLLGAVLAAGFYNIFSRRAALKHRPIDITFIMMWLGALVFNTIGLIQSYLNGQLNNYIVAIQHLPVVNALLYLGLMSSVLAFFLLNYALSNLPASRTAVFINLTPIVSVLAGVLIYNEQLGIWQMVGVQFILLGVWGTNYFVKVTHKKEPLDNSKSPLQN